MKTNRIGIRLYAFVLLVVSVPAMFAQDVKTRLAEKASAMAQEEMKKQGIAGLEVAIVVDGKIAVSQAFGSADLEQGATIKPTTLVRTGSIAKPITAVAAMKLYESGKLDLDAPVQKYCPAFPQKQWTVTTRQLLGHLGGVRHYRDDSSDFMSAKHYAKLTDGFELFASDPLLHEPGTKFAYTTHGYSVVGCVIEGVTGEEIGAALKELVLTPAGMWMTRVDNVFEIVPGRSRPYSHDKERAVINAPFVDTSNKIPGGGLISTAEDLAQLAMALEQGKVLKPETTKLMWTSQKTKDGKATDYGYGWQVRDENGVRVIEHGGSQPGASTAIRMVPEIDFAVAIMANTDQVNVRKIAIELTNIAVEARAAVAK